MRCPFGKMVFRWNGFGEMGFGEMAFGETSGYPYNAHKFANLCYLLCHQKKLFTRYLTFNTK